jgi:hypothetical protein
METTLEVFTTRKSGREAQFGGAADEPFIAPTARSYRKA